MSQRSMGSATCMVGHPIWLWPSGMGPSRSRLINSWLARLGGPAAEAEGSRARDCRCSEPETATNQLPTAGWAAEARPPAPGSRAPPGPSACKTRALLWRRGTTVRHNGTRIGVAMAEAASAQQAASATAEDTSQQRAGRRRRTSTEPQRAQHGATAAAALCSHMESPMLIMRTA